MIHCHNKAVFLYRDSKVRTFWCSVCDVFIKISDTGKRWEERNQPGDAVAILEAFVGGES